MIESISLKCTCGKIRTFNKSEFADAMLERYECGCENDLDLYPNQRIIWLSDQINDMYRFLSESDDIAPIGVKMDNNIPSSRYMAFISFCFRLRNHKEPIHLYFGCEEFLPKKDGETVMIYRDEMIVPAYPGSEAPRLGPNLIRLIELLRFWNMESDQMPYLSNYSICTTVPGLQQFDEH